MKYPNQPKQVPAYLLTILRIYLGVILLITVYGKLSAATPFSAEMLGYLKYVMKAKIPPPFYLNFLQGVVAPNAKLFSYLIMTGEVVAGLGLLLGAFTRVTAFTAMLLFLNYMFSKGQWFWSPNSEDAAVFFIALVLMIGRAGRCFGLDAYLAKKWPGKVFW